MLDKLGKGHQVVGDYRKSKEGEGDDVYPVKPDSIDDILGMGPTVAPNNGGKGKTPMTCKNIKLDRRA